MTVIGENDDQSISQTQRTLDMLREEWTKPYRDALIPFAFIGRGPMADLGLSEEYEAARRLLGLEVLPDNQEQTT